MKIILSILLLGLPALADNVGYFVASGDPLTASHRAVIGEALKNQNHKLQKIYVVIPRGNYLASNGQRGAIARNELKEFGNRVEVVVEPLEGFPAHATYLGQKHIGSPSNPGKVIVVSGDEPSRSEYGMFTPEGKVVKLENGKPSTTEIPLVTGENPNSKKVKDMISRGGSPAGAGLISTASGEFITQNKLYQVPHPDVARQREPEYQRRHAEFIAKMKSQFPSLNWKSVLAPPFNATQHPDAQNENFIREAMNTLKPGLEKEFELRKAASQHFGYRSYAKPLRSKENEGVYVGAFEKLSPRQQNTLKNTIRTALLQGKLDKMKLMVLESSPGSKNSGISERTRALGTLLREFGNRVEIISVPSMEAVPEQVRGIANEHSTPTLVLFEEMAFPQSQAAVKEVPNLRFGVVPYKPERAGTTPVGPGVLIIDPGLLFENCLTHTTGLKK